MDRANVADSPAADISLKIIGDLLDVGPRSLLGQHSGVQPLQEKS